MGPAGIVLINGQ